MSKCEVEACTNKARCRKRCRKHWRELEPAKSLAETFDDHWVPEDGPMDTPCHVWQRSKHPRGYGRLFFRGRVFAHRFSWQRSVGEIPDGLHVLHKCDNTSCVNPDHLFLGTHTDNMKDKIRKGRGNHARGKKNPASKLTETDVERIRDIKRVGGVTQGKIALHFNIGQAQISSIVRNSYWRTDV